MTIGAPDPRQLAAFYARMLDWQVAADEHEPGAPPHDAWVQLRPPAGRTGPRLNFEYEGQHAAPVWPSEPGRQVATQHLDIAVSDLDQGVARAVEAGATLASYQPQQHVRVLLDPAGHPFCLYLEH